MRASLAWTAKVAEVRTDSVVLRFEDGQRLAWPRHLLPEHIAVGAPVWLATSTHPLPEEHRHHVGRHVLNELLHGA